MQEFCAKLVIITIDFSKAVCYNEITKKQYIQKLKKQVFCVKAFSPTSSRVNLPLAKFLHYYFVAACGRLEFI
jgi:hypothetical protein